MPALGARARLVLRVSLCVIAIAVLVAAAGLGTALLMAPPVLLAIVLSFGRYPGERVIQRLRNRPAPASAVRAPLAPRAPRTLGARLSALAVPGSGRSPPVTAALL